ncbi:tRNA 2-thiouridine(34) synthase MnmA [Guyparkeria hydrothermalis]|uniref:tRNA 2-thiouridine(34) synthase MnmA n=1 Tax=Guyparkeria hydrothermalis TaxID=923 RepID=UPI002021B687|nr:tRNA 2-thiouridine(34) synthase MnmA [Guyparkeria hydrothermalis]MCL7743660.1 tRNA 2-thiouridine(34) synthase MnmA [Guyparkeria hydrothermalis]
MTDTTLENLIPPAPADAPRIMVGMSGGVDSSVAALLLKEAGYRVEGLFMKNWEGDDDDEYCAAKEDMLDAMAVADKLGIEFHYVNFASEYWDRVFEHFLHEYQAGRTPNPDILCNREIKFRAFLDHARSLGADAIATGHYARRLEGPAGPRLGRGLDENKDQSYFLHALTREQVGSAYFPVGELEKPRVREIAAEHDLITAGKKDSTGICFIGERRFADFLKNYLPAQPGPIETLNGERLGTHQGLMYHTIGQRQGLGIGGTKSHGDAPWYVSGKDLDSNTLLVVQGKNHPALFAHRLEAEQVHWIEPPPNDRPLTAKIRYRQPDQAVSFEQQGDRLVATFEQAQRAITPGQSVVFYDGPVCLGGAVITRALPDG